MTTPRDIIVDTLNAHVPDTIRVEKYAREIDPPRRSTALVRIDRVEKDPSIPQVWRRYEFSIVLIARKSTAGKVDDELDKALEDILNAIDDDGHDLTWSSAERGVYQDTYPAYIVTLSVPFDHPKE